VSADLGRIAVRGYYTEEPVTRASGGGVLRSNSRVFHTVNGQIQHRESRGFLTECGLPALKDHMVIIVDASHLTRKAHFEIWKADREMLKQNVVSDRYLAEIKAMVKASPDLKRLNDETMARQLTSAVDTTTKTVFQKLVEKDSSLANLLSGHLPSLASLSGVGVRVDRKDPPPAYQGTYSPEFFEVSAKASGVEIPRGGKAIIQARTTVSDDYMVRDVHPGRIVVSDNLTEAGVVIQRASLKSGRLMLGLSAPEDAELGEMQVTVGLTDASMDGRVAEAGFLVRIVEATEKPEPNPDPKPRKKPEPKQNQLSLPQIVLLTRDGRKVNDSPTEAWNGDWTEYDGGTTIDGGEGGILIKVNYDNAYIQEYLRRAKEGERGAIWTKFMLAMQVSALGLERRIAQLREGGEKVSEDEIDRLRRTVSAGFASVAATIVDQMPRVMNSSLGNMLVEE